MVAVRAQGAAYFGHAWDSWGLNRVDLPTASLTEAILPDAVTALALSPGGDLYAVLLAFNPGSSMVTPKLVRVEPLAHAYQVVAALDLDTSHFPELEVGLAFDALGRLWLTDGAMLHEVDPQDGHFSWSAPVGFEVVGLTGCGATLFGLTPGSDTEPARLLRIHPGSGLVEPLAASASLNGSQGGGLDFGLDGRLWASVPRIDNIGVPIHRGFMAELDPLTGEVIQSWPTFLDVGRGLAIAPPLASCPGRGVTEVPALEGGGLALLTGLLSLSAIALLRRSQTRAG